MTFTIRAAEPEDAEVIRRIRTMPGVMKCMLSYSIESISSIRKDILDEDNFFLVAIDNNNDVVGYTKLAHCSNPRQRHKGRISIAVDANYHHKGIGTLLLKEILDFADNQLKLLKVDLTVQQENGFAIKLYEKFNFVKEGYLKYDCVCEGNYSDVFLMARYNLPEMENNKNE